MKHTRILFFALLMVILGSSCSRNSGCPAESAQTKVSKDGEYKANKTKSGLLPPKVYKKKKG